MEELNAIRERLKKHHLSFVWLIHQLRQRGIMTDKTEVSSVFAGTRTGVKANAIVTTSKHTLDDYEHGKVLVCDGQNADCPSGGKAR